MRSQQEMIVKYQSSQISNKVNMIRKNRRNQSLDLDRSSKEPRDLHTFYTANSETASMTNINYSPKKPMINNTVSSMNSS